MEAQGEEEVVLERRRQMHLDAPEPTTTLGVARLQKSLIPVSEREEMSTLNGRTIK